MGNPNFRVPGTSRPSNNGWYIAVSILVVVGIALVAGLYMASKWLVGGMD